MKEQRIASWDRHEHKEHVRLPAQFESIKQRLANMVHQSECIDGPSNHLSAAELPGYDEIK